FDGEDGATGEHFLRKRALKHLVATHTAAAIRQEADVIVLRTRFPAGRCNGDHSGKDKPGHGHLPRMRHREAAENIEHAASPSLNAETMPYSRPALYEGR